MPPPFANLRKPSIHPGYEIPIPGNLLDCAASDEPQGDLYYCLGVPGADDIVVSPQPYRLQEQATYLARQSGLMPSLMMKREIEGIKLAERQMKANAKSPGFLDKIIHRFTHDCKSKSGAVKPDEFEAIEPPFGVSAGAVGPCSPEGSADQYDRDHWLTLGPPPAYNTRLSKQKTGLRTKNNCKDIEKKPGVFNFWPFTRGVTKPVEKVYSFYKGPATISSPCLSHHEESLADYPTGHIEHTRLSQASNAAPQARGYGRAQEMFAGRTFVEELQRALEVAADSRAGSYETIMPGSWADPNTIYDLIIVDENEASFHWTAGQYYN